MRPIPARSNCWKESGGDRAGGGRREKDVRWTGSWHKQELVGVEQRAAEDGESVGFDEGKGVTAEAVERWREVLDPSEVAAVQRTCAALMASNGYEPISTTASVLARLRPYATFPYASLEALRANGDRSGGLPSFVARRVRALLSG